MVSTTTPGGQPWYYIPQPSHWPIVGAIALLLMGMGAAFWFNGYGAGAVSLALGFAIWAALLAHGRFGPRVGYGPDSALYLKAADAPVWSRRFLAGPGAFGFPLLAKLCLRNLRAIVIVQSVVSVGAWAFLATVASGVVHSTAARDPVLVRPNARKPAERSSMRVCSRSSPALAASYAAKESGALRDPGARTTSRTPARTSAVITARANSVEELTDSPHPVGPPSHPVRRGL